MSGVLVTRLRSYYGRASFVLDAVYVTALVTMLVSAGTSYTALRITLILLLSALYYCLLRFGVRSTANKPLALGVSLMLLILVCVAIAFAGDFSGGFWLLFLPVIQVGTELLTTRWLILLCGAELLAFSSAIWLANNSFAAVWQLGLLLFPALIFVVFVTKLNIREQRARNEVEVLNRKLASANQKLREYAAQAEELATSVERNRLAREIHDGVGHFLTTINVQIEAAKTLVETDPQRARSALDKAQSLTREALADVRRSVAALRVGPTDDRPLTDALQALIDETRNAGLVSQLHLLGEPRPLPPQVTNTLYRAAQEALTNVRKHALASHVDLTLDYSAQNEIRLLVQDNGVGGSNNDSGGFGLLGVQERAHIIGGAARITTAPGQGFLLEVAAPA